MDALREIYAAYPEPCHFVGLMSALGCFVSYCIGQLVGAHRMMHEGGKAIKEVMGRYSR